MIKIISFDVWNTLITPNTYYGPLRDKIIAEHLNIELNEAHDLYQSTKDTLDKIALVTGKNFSSQECWRILHQRVCKMKSSLVLQNKIEHAFIANLPKLDTKLISAISTLHQKGYILKICSNTNFISGKILNKLFAYHLAVFRDTFYSDITGVAKPDKGMFDNLLQGGFLPEEVLHIGDSLEYDGGSKRAGMNFFQVKNPADLYSSLVSGKLYTHLWELDNIDKRG